MIVGKRGESWGGGGGVEGLDDAGGWRPGGELSDAREVV